MIDLMPCQICGSQACPKTYHVRCLNESCNVRSPTAWNNCFPRNGDRAELVAKVASNWNEMQANIARGKLLGDAPKSKGGRL